MSVGYRTLTAFALASALAGCSGETQVSKSAAAPKPEDAPAKSAALANLGQVVLEVPGMT